MHASDRYRPLAGNAVVQRHDAAAIDAPWNLVLLLASGDATVAFDATLGIAQEFHSGHGRILYALNLRRELLDLAKRRLRFLHHRHGVVAVRRRRVDCLAANDRRSALRIELEHVLAHPPAGEVERDERRALANAFGHLRLHLELRARRRLHPDEFAVPHAAIVGVDRIDLDEAFLLQLGEPAIA